MAERSASVDIGVRARVDRSVSRAFRQLEQQNRRLGRDSRRLSRDTDSLGRRTRRTGRSVGEFSRHLNAAGRRIKHYANNIGEVIRRNDVMRKSLDKMGAGLDHLGNKWTGLATGAVGAGSAAAVMGLEERYERLGIQAGKSKQEMTALRKAMFATSQQSDIRVDQGEMLSAVEKIVEKTGDLKFAQDNMANIGRVMQATGAAGEDVGEMFADMSQKFGLKNSKDVLSAIDTLVVQGKAGAFTLQNLAAEGAAVSAAYAAMGRTGPKAVQEMGALLQMARMGSGSAAEAAGSTESVLEDITSNYKDIEKLGVEVFDQEALARGERKFRSIPLILKEVMKETKGDITEYSQYFGDETMRMMKVLAGADGKKLDSFLAIQGDGTAVIQDSARAARTATAAMQNLKSAWMSFADQQLAGPISALADAVNSINPETLNAALTGATAVAGTLGAAWAGRKIWTAGKSIAGFFRGNDQTTEHNPLSGDNQVMKVFVTNMPGRGGLGDDRSRSRRRRRRNRGRNRSSRNRYRRERDQQGPERNQRRRRRPRRGGSGSWGRLSRLARLGRRSGMLRGLTRKIPYVGALIGALDIGSTLMDSSLNQKQKSTEVGGSLGGLGGALAGGVAGAAIGSVVPVIGTAIGGVIGSVIGGLGGESIGGWLGGWIGSPEQPKPGKTIQQHAMQSTTVQSKNIQPSDPRETHHRKVDQSQHDSPSQTPIVNSPQPREITQITHRVQQYNQQQQASHQTNFSPVFHIQGAVDDKQIEKLEKMVMRMTKQMDKLGQGQRNVSFADS